MRWLRSNGVELLNTLLYLAGLWVGFGLFEDFLALRLPPLIQGIVHVAVFLVALLWGIQNAVKQNWLGVTLGLIALVVLVGGVVLPLFAYVIR